MPQKNIIVIGASAGGIEALTRLIGDLPADLPAAVFVVIHVAAQSRSMLPAILNRCGKLRAAHAEDGEAIRYGHIYIAPPDYHLLIREDSVRVVRGPKENGFRPAVDPMFRTAAHVYGRQVIGVVLSGALDDGTAGLQAIKGAGGIAIVQNPEEALYPGMPRSAVEHVAIDYIGPIAEIAPLLTRLAREHAPMQGEITMSDQTDMYNAIVQKDKSAQESGGRPDAPSIFTCPECGGVLWEMDDSDVIRYRCHVGHVYSTASMLSEHSATLEAALWTAVRALEESASLSRRLATRLRKRGQNLTVARFEAQAQDAARGANLIRQVLHDLNAMTDLEMDTEEINRN